MHLRSFVFVVVVIWLGFLSACQTEQVKPAPDVSSIDVEVELIRYDKLLKNIDPQDPAKSYLKLIADHPVMTDLYFKQLTNLFNDNDEKFHSNLAEFASDKRITSLADTVTTVFGNTSEIESKLAKTLKYLKHYFPEYDLPRFYTIFSEFSYQTFIFKDSDGKDAIGLGLDLFLGENFEYKKVDPSNPAFSDYLSRAYNKDHFVKKAVEMLVEDLVGKPDGKRFIDLMVHQGKKQYILEKLLPFESDTVLWEYTPSQLTWVSDNELQVWDFFLDENLIYETSHLKTANYLQPAPHSKGMPDMAPGRTGSYIGYKIISSLMRRNDDLSLRELINMQKSQAILEKSRYKPARK